MPSEEFPATMPTEEMVPETMPSEEFPATMPIEEMVLETMPSEELPATMRTEGMVPETEEMVGETLLDPAMEDVIIEINDSMKLAFDMMKINAIKVGSI